MFLVVVLRNCLLSALKKNIFYTPTLFDTLRKEKNRKQRKKTRNLSKYKRKEEKKRDTMATDILDKQRFKNQCSLYESTRLPLENDAINRSNSTAMSKINQNHRKKYATQTPTTSNNSHRQHHSESTDILSLIRSFAFKPFKTSSMANTFTGGQAHHPVLSDSQMSTTKSSVNLLNFRPLSDVVTDHASYTQSTYVNDLTWMKLLFVFSRI